MSIVAPWYLYGDVVPHLHTDMGQYQFYKVAPDGVMLVTSQWHLEEYSLAAVEAELDALNRGIDVLAERGVDYINVGGVPVGGALTRPRMLRLLADAEQRTGLPCSTSFEAHIAAMQHLGVQKVALATRWAPDLNELVTAYLAAADIDVVSCRYQGRDLTQNMVASPAADRELLLDLGRKAVHDSPDVDGLMLPGGLGFVVHAAAELEAELGVPTFTNITATIWAGLRRYAGALPHTPSRGWGRLLDSLST